MLGIPRTTMSSRVGNLGLKGGIQAAASFDPLPPGDVVDDAYVEGLCRAFHRRDDREKARDWRTIRLPVSGPFGILLVGDEHLDDPFCNLPLLRLHLDLTLQHEDLFSFFMGDMLNSWPMGGKLGRLQGKQEMSKAKGIQLAQWFTQRYGAKTIGRIWGNHDEWDEGLIAVMNEMIGGAFPTFDWDAKLEIRGKTGRAIRMNAAHNFKGTSALHKEHGLQREIQDGEACDIMVAGHHHNFVMQQEQHSKRGFVYWLIRARGYKWHDDHARKLQFGQQPAGAAVLAVCDPENRTPENVVTCFADPFEGLDYLQFKKRKLAA